MLTYAIGRHRIKAVRAFAFKRNALKHGRSDFISVPEKTKQDKTIEDVSKLAEDVVSKLGLLLVAVGILQQGKRRVLNITIHRKGSRVSLDDCENVSRNLEAVLEEHANGENGPVIEGAYVLDVESPGIDRVLKKDSDYRIFEGETVELRLKQSVDGLPLTIKGTLVRLDADQSDSVVHIKNPSSLEASKTSKSKGNSKKDAPSTLKEEIALPLSSLYSVRLYPELSLAASKDADDDQELEIEEQ